MNALKILVVAWVAVTAGAGVSAEGSVIVSTADVNAGCKPLRAEILWTRSICVQTNRYIGWPTVCRLKNGDILAVFSGDREEHVCPYGKVQMVRSKDGGETWSEPQTIANGILDDRDAGIVQLKSGEILVTWFTSIVYGTDRETVWRHPEYKAQFDKLDPAAVKEAKGYFLMRSTDDGRTWSKPERLLCDHAPHGPIVLKDGSLLQVGRDQERVNSDQVINEISVMRSTDAGRTWQTLCPRLAWAKGDNTKPGLAHEPHVAELADGTLVAQVRYHGDNHLRQSVSRDGGKTWSTLEKTPLAGFPPHLLVLPDGKLVSVYGRRWGKCGEYASISEDGGKTWDVEHEILLAPSHNGDLGYPASTLLADGSILTVYYQQPAPGQKPCLMATKWRVLSKPAVSVSECPKCDRRFRISEDGMMATVNASRLKDDSPDETTFRRRLASVTARAEAYLARAQKRANGDVRCPLMGWSSWNTFGVDISEEIILDTARTMATNGLKAAGYLYVNIDDGFFNGHGEDGVLRFHPQRFPKGLKGTVDGIHALGLRAGIYSDAGADTCGSMWSGDALGRGSGLYGHDAADCKLHFNDLGFDFIKVDYCGGQALKLDERARYAEIAAAIRATGRTDVRFNICRWAFPGVWAADIAGSWRTTGDIRATWWSVRHLIGENLYLGAYAKPGHYNDMDMLEVGQRKGRVKSAFGKYDEGLTEDEEITHFGLWCMMSSPLLIGCDVRTIPAESLKLVTNPFLVQMNQNNGLGVQGRVVARSGEAYVIAKDADEPYGTSRYVALYNGSDVKHEFCVKASDLELGGTLAAFDLVDRSDLGEFGERLFVTVASHASRFFRVDADHRLERTTYEAESAYLSDYQELKDAVEAETAFPAPYPSASGGMAVRYLGNRAGNDLVWKDVRIVKGGRRTLEFLCATPDDRSFFVEVDGANRTKVDVPTSNEIFSKVSVEVELTPGVHAVRLSNPTGWAPDVDVMFVR